MNSHELNFSPSLIKYLTDLTTDSCLESKFTDLFDCDEKTRFSGHSTIPCEPLNTLNNNGSDYYNRGSVQTEKQRFRMIKEISLNNSVNTQTPTELSSPCQSKTPISVIQPLAKSVSTTETEQCKEKRARDRIRKAIYRKTETGKIASRNAKIKYQSSRRGRSITDNYQANYRKSTTGIISRAIANAKSNARISALKKGYALDEARAMGEAAAKAKKSELLASLNPTSVRGPLR